jgi:hypothetical protein
MLDAAPSEHARIHVCCMCAELGIVHLQTHGSESNHNDNVFVSTMDTHACSLLCPLTLYDTTLCLHTVVAVVAVFAIATHTDGVT